MENQCPICKKIYSRENPKEEYHLRYKEPAEATFACKECNWIEFLFRHLPENPKLFLTKYALERIKQVETWNIKVRTELKSFQNGNSDCSSVSPGSS